MSLLVDMGDPDPPASALTSPSPQLSASSQPACVSKGKGCVAEEEPEPLAVPRSTPPYARNVPRVQVDGASPPLTASANELEELPAMVARDGVHHFLNFITSM
jgi:hypothetical protein